jgi:hypothetical protein
LSFRKALFLTGVERQKPNSIHNFYKTDGRPELKPRSRLCRNTEMSTTALSFFPNQHTHVAEASVRDGILSIHAGSYDLQFVEDSAWTIRQMSYDGRLLLTSAGAYQSVVNMREQGGTDQFSWIGTGHGGEVIEALYIEVDGVPHPVEDGLRIHGNRFSLHKQSLLGPYRHWAEISLDEFRLHEKFDYEVVADDRSVNFLYAFMHCFSKTFDEWHAETLLGAPDTDYTARESSQCAARDSGVFTSDKSFTLKKDIRRAMLYSHEEALGLLYEYPQVYKGATDFCNAFWNRPTDNKLYFRPVIPAGFGSRFAYEVTLRAFHASPASWREVASSLSQSCQGV